MLTCVQHWYQRQAATLFRKMASLGKRSTKPHNLAEFPAMLAVAAKAKSEVAKMEAGLRNRGLQDVDESNAAIDAQYDLEVVSRLVLSIYIY